MQLPFMPTKPIQLPNPSLDEPWDRILNLRKPIEEAMSLGDWKKACELFVENIILAEQMLDFARRYGSQMDINNCERRVELYRQTYSQLTAEARYPTPCNCDLPLELEPEERKITQASQNDLPVAGHRISEQISKYMQLMARVSELNAQEREEFHNLMEIVATDGPALTPTPKTIASLWHVERRNQNAEEIAERAAKLPDKSVGFIAELGPVGDRLTQAQTGYREAIDKLAKSKGNLVRQVECVKELGAKRG
jgi:hypothetical protein